jgi:hypothetical protein
MFTRIARVRGGGPSCKFLAFDAATLAPSTRRAHWQDAGHYGLVKWRRLRRNSPQGFGGLVSGCAGFGRRRAGNPSGPVVGHERAYFIYAQLPDRSDCVIVVAWDQSDRDGSVRPGLGVGVAHGACRGQVAVSASQVVLHTCDRNDKGLSGRYRPRCGEQVRIELTRPRVSRYGCPRAEGRLTAKDAGDADHAGVVVGSKRRKFGQRDRCVGVLADGAECLCVGKDRSGDSWWWIGEREAVCSRQRAVFRPEGKAVRGSESPSETKSWKDLAYRLPLRVDEFDGQTDLWLLVAKRIDGNAACYHTGRISAPDEQAT